MQPISITLLSVLALTVLAANAQTAQQVTIPESSLQQPQSPVHQLQLNSSVVTAHALGSIYFMINQSNLIVYTISAPPPGSYQLTLVILEQGAMLPLHIPLRVYVTPNAESACQFQVFGKCSQLCVPDPSPRGYACSCAPDYTLQRDKLTCLASGPLPLLLVATSNGLVQFDPLTRLSMPLVVNGTPHYFDYYYGNQEVYYADNTLGKISRVSVATRNESLFLSNPGHVTGLVVNWIDRSLVYSTQECLIMVDLVNGTNTTLHCSLAEPRNLLLVTQQDQRLLYWVEGNSTFSIMSSSLAGGQPVTVATSTAEPLALSVDRVLGELFWITADELCRLDDGVTTCSECCEGGVPTGLAVFEMSAYISMAGGDQIVEVGREGSSEPAVYSELSSPGALLVLHPLAQPPAHSGANDCEECAQLCVVANESLSCDCRAGFTLGSDGTSCFIDEVAELVLAEAVGEKNNVIKVSRSGAEVENLVDIFGGPFGEPVTGLIYAMDYDITTDGGVLYFNDRENSSLWKVALSRQHEGGDDRELVLRGVRAWDIAMDWMAKKLYWSDESGGTIDMAPVADPLSRVTIISGRDQPQGLEVDPINSYLYWVEVGTNSIWRYSLTSLLPEVFVSELPSLSDLVLDHHSQTLYWSQLSGDIGSISLDGSNRQLLYSNPGDSPFKLALFREFLIWIDGANGDYHIINRNGDNEKGTIPISPAGIRALTSLLVASNSRQLSLEEYRCIHNELGCSHYCELDQTDAAFCTCPPDYNLAADGATCLYSGPCPLCGGSCDVQGGTVSCQCPPGLRGRDCDQFCEAGMFGDGCSQLCTCLNGASCDPVNGTCYCTEGYQGSNCEQPVCEMDCLNGGICSAPNTCSCAATFTGPTCSNRICTDDYCFNGGTCRVDFDVEISCQCPASTSGSRCEINDIILLPQMIAVAVGSPLGAIFGIIVIAILVSLGVFYYISCRGKRKTNPQETTHTKDLEAGGGRGYGSVSPTSQPADTELTDSPYHVYVQT